MTKVNPIRDRKTGQLRGSVGGAGESAPTAAHRAGSQAPPPAASATERTSGTAATYQRFQALQPSADVSYQMDEDDIEQNIRDNQRWAESEQQRMAAEKEREKARVEREMQEWADTTWF